MSGSPRGGSPGAAPAAARARPPPHAAPAHAGPSGLQHPRQQLANGSAPGSLADLQQQRQEAQGARAPAAAPPPAPKPSQAPDSRQAPSLSPAAAAASWSRLLAAGAGAGPAQNQGPNPSLDTARGAVLQAGGSLASVAQPLQGLQAPADFNVWAPGQPVATGFSAVHPHLPHAAAAAAAVGNGGVGGGGAAPGNPAHPAAAAGEPAGDAALVERLVSGAVVRGAARGTLDASLADVPRGTKGIVNKVT